MLALIYNFFKSSIAGLLATIPMTLAMRAMYRWLPWWHKEPLPPHEVVSETLEKIGLKEVDDEHHDKVTFAAHFGFGASSASFYSLIHLLPLPVAVKGALYGLTVWSLSYIGVLPAVEVATHAHERPTKRNLLMVIAHLVWGVSLGWIYNRLPDNDDVLPYS